MAGHGLAPIKHPKVPAGYCFQVLPPSIDCHRPELAGLLSGKNGSALPRLEAPVTAAKRWGGLCESIATLVNATRLKIPGASATHVLPRLVDLKIPCP